MRLSWLILIALSFAGCAHGASRACDPSLRACPFDKLVQASQCGGGDGSVKYRSSNEAELAEERAFFTALLRAAVNGEAAVTALASDADRLGFELRICPDGAERMACVVEQPAARRGRGAYVVRLGTAEDLLVQTPHSFSDSHTLPMGLDMFRRSRARVLATSTLHRRGAAGYGDSDGRRPPPRGKSDVAHDARSTFQAMTLAWLDTSTGPVVQLHGFSDGRTDADIVLSTGAEAAAPAWVRGVQKHLASLLPGRVVAVYPDDVHDLGATSNAQGKAVRAASGRFLHVEMNASLRESLRRRKADRGRYVDRLADALLEQQSASR
jgi:hypothetical protein